MLESIRIWHLKALCRNADYVSFFPDSGIGDLPYIREVFCSRCPVVQQCLTYALVHDEYGIWGGTSRAERDRYPKRVVKYLRSLYRQAGLLEYRPLKSEPLEELQQEQIDPIGGVSA